MTHDVAGPSVASAGSIPLDQIICGDNCEVMRQMPSESIDLVVTSPPYDDLRTYGGHSWDFYGVAWNLKRLLKPGGVIVWNVADSTKDGDESGASYRQALHFKGIGLRLLDTMIWNKPPKGANGSKFAYPQSAEFMFVFANGLPATVNRITDRPNATAGKVFRKTAGGRCVKNGARATGSGITPAFGLRTNVWQMNVGGDGNEHPAPFPEALARDHILSWSNPGDVVLDPFSGSGTTAKMARETGRRFIGIEVNPEYVEISRKRLAQQALPIGVA
jgi:site-specific DNA-methyltransferase (adenine-specific)